MENTVKKRVMINDDQNLEGAAFSFTVKYDPASSPPLIDIEGTLSYSGAYIPNITTIENERYRLDGVRVYAESFGSDDSEILYHFKAKAFAL